MGRSIGVVVVGFLAMVACGSGDSPQPGSTPDPTRPVSPAIPQPAPEAGAAPAAKLPEFGLGARVDEARGLVSFRVWSAKATRVELALFGLPRGEDDRLTTTLVREPGTAFWSAEVPLADVKAAGITTIYYGFRTWGPNWPYDAAWKRGTEAGFVADVDEDGNRFNPNKLLYDPYALELSHDPFSPEPFDGRVYEIGPGNRVLDSGKLAPKGVVVLGDAAATSNARPTRALKDDVIYEVQVRGLTMSDPSVPEAERGTFRGAARKAAYLRQLGVTAIELLPIHETQNDQNDASPLSQNYWGYATLGYFAPDRRFAADKTPGGPTRELRAMVDAFHAEGIKVFLDVVYNHTGEGGSNHLFSWRGFGATDYYEAGEDPRTFIDNNGVGPNFHPRSAAATQLVLDSLAYASSYLGVDGFRFDLASVHGDACSGACFGFDKTGKDNILNRAVKRLPARPLEGGEGVDLIAEPWAIGLGTYQVGNFPSGWAEWNGAYRDAVRMAQNRAGVADISPRAMAERLLGSRDLFADDGRTPGASINFVVAHDGFTLRDLYSYGQKNNEQPQPFGPSQGGTDDNVSWDHGGVAAEQQKAARTGMLLLAVSSGVPMMLGGDELYRTQRGNNNAYNLDNEATWLDWSALSKEAAFHSFVAGVLRLRAEHPALRPEAYLDGEDKDGNGVADLTLLTAAGTRATGTSLDDGGQRFVAMRLDGLRAKDPARSLYVAYNWSAAARPITLPAPVAGMAWRLAAQSALGVTSPLGQEPPVAALTMELPSRSVVVLVER